MFDETKVLCWPVGNGDSTSVVIKKDVVLQVDLNHLESADEEGDDHAAIIDELVKNLPRVKDENSDEIPYLPAFALTHPDQDHIRGFEGVT